MDGFDVDGRLAEGEPIVDDLMTYVAACEALGHPYSGPDLRQLYSAETGLDLHALDADHRSLVSVADTADHALSVQDNASRSLTGSWSGIAGASATAFAARQGHAAHTLVAGLRRASDALAALRDDLARAVAGKVEAVLAAGDQLAGRRETWLAASRTVLGGGGDRAVASEIVDQQVKPFVDSVVFGEVSAALRAATNSVANSYDSAISVVRGAPVAFEMPDAWPVPSPRPVEFAAQTAPAVQAAPVIGSAATAPTIPAALITSVPAAATAAAPAAVTGPIPESTLPAPAPVSPAAPAAGPGDLGIGSAAGGLGRTLADVISGTLGSAAGLVPDATALDGGVDVPDATDDAGHSHDDATVDEKKPDEKNPDDEDQPADADPEPEPTDQPDTAEPEPAPPVPEPEPVPTPPEPVAEPAAAQPESVAKTPCQIAADELPQVGD